MLELAIKQSRAVAADSPDAHVPLSLFRGVGKREMDGKFVIERVRAESNRRIICLNPNPTAESFA